jgi:AcrR family transcriptional regulator
MPRSPQPTRERLVEAAAELFTAHGYAATTIDDIAERAGVSPRTFFRHFPDKEEVLFADDDELLPVITTAITAGKEPVRAQDLMIEVLGGLADVMEPARHRLRQRQHVIDGDVALTGRELAKQARWQVAIAEALVTRGFTPHASDLLATVGFTLFRGALHQWLAEDGGPPLRDRAAASLPEVRVVLDEVSRTRRLPSGGS